MICQEGLTQKRFFFSPSCTSAIAAAGTRIFRADSGSSCHRNRLNESEMIGAQDTSALHATCLPLLTPSVSLALWASTSPQALLLTRMAHHAMGLRVLVGHSCDRARAVLEHIADTSAERRQTHPPIQRYDAFTWSQDLDGIEVELLQFGDALHQGRHTQQQRYERLTITRRSPTITLEEDVGTQLRQHLSGITVAHRREPERNI